MWARRIWYACKDDPKWFAGITRETNHFVVLQNCMLFRASSSSHSWETRIRIIQAVRTIIIWAMPPEPLRSGEFLWLYPSATYISSVDNNHSQSQIMSSPDFKAGKAWGRSGERRMNGWRRMETYCVYPVPPASQPSQLRAIKNYRLHCNTHDTMWHCHKFKDVYIFLSSNPIIILP